VYGAKYGGKSFERMQSGEDPAGTRWNKAKGAGYGRDDSKPTPTVAESDL